MAGKPETQRIYALGAVLGMVENGHKDDTLHQYVYSLTGQSSIAALTAKEAEDVISALLALKDAAHLPRRALRRSVKEQPGKISPNQQRYVWALMYDLAEIDPCTSKSVGERLCAVIKKTLGVDASVERSFAWLSTEQGNTLIEALKGYVRSAAKGHKKAR